MQLKKINDNKLKVIISSSELNQKNIDIDSFLSSSIESQDLFFEILDLAEEKCDFNIEDNKAMVETISLDNNIFILTITKLKQYNENSNLEASNVYMFENIDDIFNIYPILDKKSTYIYEFFNKYYLFIDNIKYNIKNILSEYAIQIKDSSILESILIEYGKRIV